MHPKKHKFNWKDLKSQKLFESDTADFVDEKRYVNDVNDLIKSFRINKKQLCLDFGCGVGGHAIELAKKGFKIIGYDPSSYYVEKAKKASKKRNVKVDFYSDNEFLKNHINKFDLVFTINFPLGYCNKKDCVRLFRQINKLLKSNGRFLLGFTYTRENREKCLPQNYWQEKNGKFYLTNAKIDKSGRQTDRYLIIDPRKNVISEWVDAKRPFYLKEIKVMLRKAGFAIVDCYMNLKKKRAIMAEDVRFIYCKKTKVSKVKRRF